MNKDMIKFGFIEDENNSKLKEVFKNASVFKEIHMDIYNANPIVSSLEPFMLLLRTIEKNAKVKIDDEENRLILSRNDRFGTYFINVLFSQIQECYYKYNYISVEFILNIQNIWYRITVLN